MNGWIEFEIKIQYPISIRCHYWWLSVDILVKNFSFLTFRKHFFSHFHFFLGWKKIHFENLSPNDNDDNNKLNRKNYSNLKLMTHTIFHLTNFVFHSFKYFQIEKISWKYDKNYSNIEKSSQYECTEQLFTELLNTEWWLWFVFFFEI